MGSLRLPSPPFTVRCKSALGVTIARVVLVAGVINSLQFNSMGRRNASFSFGPGNAGSFLQKQTLPATHSPRGLYSRVPPCTTIDGFILRHLPRSCHDWAFSLDLNSSCPFASSSACQPAEPQLQAE